MPQPSTAGSYRRRAARGCALQRMPGQPVALERPAVRRGTPRASPRACRSSCGRASPRAAPPAGRSRGRRRSRPRGRAACAPRRAAPARPGARSTRSRARRRRGRRRPRRAGSPGSASPTSAGWLTTSSPSSTRRSRATCTRWTASTTSPRRTTTLSGSTRRSVDVPELPEVEAWRRQLDPDVKRYPIDAGRARAHRDAEDVRPAALGARGRGASQGARRRAKRFLFPTDDGELVLMVHLMSAGRLRYLARGREGPEDADVPARASRTAASSCSPRRAPSGAPGVWLLRPDALEEELAHLGPEADELDAESLGRDPRLRLAPAALAAARPAR